MSESQDLYLGKKSYSVLGKRPVRHDGADKVTGKAIYTADLVLPNMAHGKIVRSSHAQRQSDHGLICRTRWGTMWVWIARGSPCRRFYTSYPL